MLHIKHTKTSKVIAFARAYFSTFTKQLPKGQRNYKRKENSIRTLEKTTLKKIETSTSVKVEIDKKVSVKKAKRGKIDKKVLKNALQFEVLQFIFR